MPKTSVSCPRSPERRDRRCSLRPAEPGFTLLELLVVLALVALLAGMVSPALIRGLAAARERGMLAEVRTILEGLPVRAFQQGKPLLLDAAALRGLMTELPEDWQLTVTKELGYSAAGVATGGRVQLRMPGREPHTWSIAPVSGGIETVATRRPAQ